MNRASIEQRLRALEESSPQVREERFAAEQLARDHAVACLKALGTGEPPPPAPPGVDDWFARRPVSRAEALAALERACPTPPGGWVKR